MDLDKLKKYLSEKYEFINLIGEGGFAEVYLAKDRMLEREVAIKILSSSYSNDKDIIANRFIKWIQPNLLERNYSVCRNIWSLGLLSDAIVL